MVKFLNEEIVKYLHTQARNAEQRTKPRENVFLDFFYWGKLTFYVEQIDEFNNNDTELVDQKLPEPNSLIDIKKQYPDKFVLMITANI